MITLDTQALGDIRRILTGIGVVSKEAMIEQSSKAGNKVRLAVRREFYESTTQWRQVYVKGKRLLLKDGIYLLGKRVSHKNMGGTDSPSNMANFITSFTHETTGTTVIGGAHKAFNPPKIRNGKIVGRWGRVSGVSHDTVAILSKLNYGNTTEGMAGKKGKYKFHGGGSQSMKDGKGKDLSDRWKRRLFFEKGWNSVGGIVIRDMTTVLKDIIGERANNVDLRKVKRAV